MKITMEQIKEAVSDVNFGDAISKYALLNADKSKVQMVLRKVNWQICDGESKEIFEYLSFANLWMGSGLNRLSEKELKERFDKGFFVEIV